MVEVHSADMHVLRATRLLYARVHVRSYFHTFSHNQASAINLYLHIWSFVSGWLDSLAPLLEWLIRERPPSWADLASTPWNIWKLLVEAWPDGALYKSPAIQRIAARMFVLMQSYTSAAAEFLADGTRPDGVGGGNEVATAGTSGGAGGRSGAGGPRGGGRSSGSGRMIDIMPRVLDRLIVCQGMMLNELTYLGWPPPQGHAVYGTGVV